MCFFRVLYFSSPCGMGHFGLQIPRALRFPFTYGKAGVTPGHHVAGFAAEQSVERPPNFVSGIPERTVCHDVVQRGVLVPDVFPCWCGEGSRTWICPCLLNSPVLEESSEPDLQRLCTNKTVKDAAWRVGLLQAREGGLSITFYCASILV